jgi:negative regulator of flagellin synthesis FlgM
MSYADGIGGLQSPLSSIAPAAKPAQQVPATGIESKGNDAPVSKGVPADHADLSTTGGLIGKALETSDTRSAKVGALQQAIASGSYRVSSSDVADKLMEALLG